MENFEKNYHEIERKLRESEAIMHSIVDMAVDAIVTIDDQGKIQTFNVAAEKMFGYKKEEVIGKNINILMPTPYHEEHDSYIQSYIKTGIKKIIGIGREVVAQKRDGTTFPIELAVSEVQHTDHRLFTGIIRDITKRKENEAKLQKANEELQIALSTREKFFSIIAHDLKAPFSLLLNLSEFLSQSNVTKKDKNQIIEDLQNVSRRTFNLLKNLLEWSKSQTGKIEFKPTYFNLCDLVQNNIDIGASNTKDIEIISKVSENMEVYADKNMIDTIVRNFLSNAIKFTHRDGRIEIGCERKGETLELCVSDNGIGIKPENIEKLFKIDVKLSTFGTEKERGNGIGLILCKEFAEKNGGNIKVESELNKGSKFFLTIPLGKNVSYSE